MLRMSAGSPFVSEPKTRNRRDADGKLQSDFAPVLEKITTSCGCGSRDECRLSKSSQILSLTRSQ